MINHNISLIIITRQETSKKEKRVAILSKEKRMKRKNLRENNECESGNVGTL